MIEYQAPDGLRGRIYLGSGSHYDIRGDGKFAGSSSDRVELATHGIYPSALYFPPDTPLPGGVAADYYVHEQSTPSNVWVINHNKGYPVCAVRVLSPGGIEIMAEVVEISLNQVIAYLNPPVAGRAIVA